MLDTQDSIFILNKTNDYLNEDLAVENISDILTEINIDLHSLDPQRVALWQFPDSVELKSADLSNLDDNFRLNSNASDDLTNIVFLPDTSTDLPNKIYLGLGSVELSNLDNSFNANFRVSSSHVTDLSTISLLSTNSLGFTGNTYLDGILWGGNRWNTGTSGQISYSFWNSGTESFDNSRGFNMDLLAYNWSSVGKASMVKALDTWETVADITFVNVGDNNANATFGFYVVNNSLDAAGMFVPPGERGAGVGYFNWQNPGVDYINGNQPGDRLFTTLIHELGHGLGLAHPHDNGGGSSIYPGVTSRFGDTGDFGLNQGIYTTMSYNKGITAVDNHYSYQYGYQGTPMAFDIAAIQHLYGANMNHNTDDNTYYLPTINASGTSFSSIWDAGGTDKISGLGASSGVVINLNDATLNITDGAGAGGYLSRVKGIFGGFTIANSVIIENADGSNYNDVLVGNEFNNVLSGNSGNDTLLGLGGNDILAGGSGNDRLLGYSSGEEYDALIGGNGFDTFVLGNSSNAFYQGDGLAIITDFNWILDSIEVKGSSSQYSLVFDNWIGDSAYDTAILYGNDVIGVVQDRTSVSISRDFVFVLYYPSSVRLR